MRAIMPSEVIVTHLSREKKLLSEVRTCGGMTTPQDFVLAGETGTEIHLIGAATTLLV